MKFPTVGEKKLTGNPTQPYGNVKEEHGNLHINIVH
jgi:hypothetical protein